MAKCQNPIVEHYRGMLYRRVIGLVQGSATRGSRAACGSFIPLRWLPVWVYAGEVSPDFLYNLNSSPALFLGQVC